jgi:hypothetical protein
MLGRDSRSAMPPASAQPFLKSSRTRRLWSVLWIGFAFLAILLACILLYNNYSFRSQSRSQFNAQLDGALERATVWIVAHPELSLRNPSIMYMIADMAKMSGDPRLQQLLYEYSQRLQHPSDALDLFWLRITDRHSPLPLIAAPELGDAGNERFWDAYALAPHNLQISNADRANMFSPTKYTWGTRHHQLLTLVMYRDFNGDNPELDSVINHLSEKIARDAHFDFRVSDSYIQRTTFVLAAGRPDLIRGRWVERILDNQMPDGSWKYCWYGWCRGIFEFNLTSPGHATVQAAWALTMLKYRYPQWIEEHSR